MRPPYIRDISHWNRPLVRVGRKSAQPQGTCVFRPLSL